MVNFGELKGLIARDLERNDLSDDGTAAISEDTVAYYVKAAIDHFKTRQFYFNQRTDTVGIPSGSGLVALPSDFIEMIMWRITTSGSQRILQQIMYKELEVIRVSSVTVNSTAPDRYAIFAQGLEVFPEPTDTTESRMSYVFELPTLDVDEDTNAWTDDARMLISAKVKEYIYNDRLHNVNMANRSAIEVEKELSKIYARSRKNNAIGLVRIEPWM